jgi:hypothetical protein
MMAKSARKTIPMRPGVNPMSTAATRRSLITAVLSVAGRLIVNLDLEEHLLAPENAQRFSALTA